MSRIKLSDRVQRIKPSPTLTVTSRAAELRAQGQDVIGLGAGEPDFDTPEPVKEAARAAITAGQTKYTPVDGTPALKQAIIDKFARENGLDYEPDQILVSAGGKQSFFNMALALLNDHDEAIIPAPYWVSYPDMVKVAGGEPVILDTGPETRFKITPEQLEAAITPRTRLFVINSPSNPSGMAYSREELTALGAVLERHPDILVATDDMYEHILWTGESFVNIVNACPFLFDRTLVMNGVSKAYSMTGWRIGYAGGPSELIAAMKKIQSQSTSNPCSISQAAAEAALTGSQDRVREMATAFRERHDWLVDALNALPGVECLAGDGTFYAFPDVRGAMTQLGMNSDTELATWLLDQTGVALVPGSAFGVPGFLRLSYAVNLDALKEAVDRLDRVLR